MINAPSLANCNVLELADNIKELVEADVDFFHIDIMDGHYVPNLCFPVNYIRDIKKAYPQSTAEVHMMVDNIGDYIDRLADAGADYVCFHCDSTNFVRRNLTQIRAHGMKAGVVINPSQRIDIIEPYIELLDYVILMTVEPGFAGQRFLPGGVERCAELSAIRKKHNADFLIEIDGGVDYETAGPCLEAGADILVTGIYVTFKQPDGIVSACRRFKKYAEEVESKI